jgi:hypothetical protein
MDRYFAKKKEMGIIIDKSELHVIGLASIFISSKFEDLIPIHMN